MPQKFIELTPEEIETLQQGHKNHPSAQVRNRCHCLLLSHQGKPVKELAQIFSVIPLTVYSWFKRWEEKGLVGLFNEKGPGRKPILTAADESIIKQQVQANAQKLSLARQHLKTELNKDFSQKTLKRFLKSLVCDTSAGESV
jgi:transposase